MTTSSAPTTPPLLIVLGGLPGTGKTTIAKVLATQLKCIYVRIDTIEQALLHENCLHVGHEGYLVAYAIAADNLRCGNNVIADSVNPIPLTRAAWRDVAARVSAHILEVEIVCSDKSEHQRRIEQRSTDIAGHKLPTWDEVIKRDYYPWETKRLTIDTAKHNIASAVEEILESVRRTPS